MHKINNDMNNDNLNSKIETIPIKKFTSSKKKRILYYRYQYLFTYVYYCKKHGFFGANEEISECKKGNKCNSSILLIIPFDFNELKKFMLELEKKHLLNL